MSTILEEGTGFGGNSNQNSTGWDRVKSKYPVTDPTAPYNSGEANFPNSTKNEFRADLSPRPNLTNLDPLLKKMKQSREGTDSMKHTVNQKVSVTPPIEGVVESDIVDELEQMCDGDPAAEPFVPVSEKKKTLEETKKMLETFRDNLAKYPKHISYDGSTVLCVLLSMKAEAQVYLNNLPSVDCQLLRDAFSDVEAFASVMVKFDDQKDFVITADKTSLTFFNTVAHPRPEDLRDSAGTVPVEKEGDQIAVGGKILLNKKGIKRLIGVTPTKRESKPEDEELPTRRQPVAGRNAYEIRADVLQMAVDWTSQFDECASEDDVVEIAKKFYSFVENKPLRY